MKPPTTKNKLGNYLALTLGAGAAATSVEGATSVTFYGQNATRHPQINTHMYTNRGLNYGFLDYGGSDNESSFAVRYAGQPSGTLFTRGTDLVAENSWTKGYFQTGAGSIKGYGAQDGDQNYVNISLNGNDGLYEAVGQFYIGGGEVWLVALAKNADDSALSISAGKTAIDGGSVSAVPEASSHLALLALGSVGLLTRRRLKRAA
jgi:hypothetical protein